VYTTCLHCQAPLGANDMIEALPIGRRLAFDAAKGRLWVVCRSCQRWNLTPFDARWEALEACERAYRDTRVRLSTDNIGLARLRDGTDLLRIGAPQRPEFAAWRYGDQFGQRRRRAMLYGAGGVVGAGLAVAGATAAGVAIGAALPIMQLVIGASLMSNHQKMLRNWVALGDGRRIAPTGRLRILQLDVEEGWGLEAGVMVPAKSEKDRARPWDRLNHQYIPGVTTVRGAHAMPLLRRFLPRINRGGATDALVRTSVEMIAAAGGPDRFAAWAATQRQAWGRLQAMGDTGDLDFIPITARLAFEMSVNEEAERRALEGELAQLETAWKEAEELASIADGLGVSARLERAFQTLRGRFG
jgi:hypothetical protein